MSHGCSLADQVEDRVREAFSTHPRISRVTIVAPSALAGTLLRWRMQLEGRSQWPNQGQISYVTWEELWRFLARLASGIDAVGPRLQATACLASALSLSDVTTLTTSSLRAPGSKIEHLEAVEAASIAMELQGAPPSSLVSLFPRREGLFSQLGLALDVHECLRKARFSSLGTDKEILMRTRVDLLEQLRALVGAIVLVSPEPHQPIMLQETGIGSLLEVSQVPETFHEQEMLSASSAQVREKIAVLEAPSPISEVREALASLLDGAGEPWKKALLFPPGGPHGLLAVQHLRLSSVPFFAPNAQSLKGHPIGACLMEIAQRLSKDKRGFAAHAARLRQGLQQLMTSWLSVPSDDERTLATAPTEEDPEEGPKEGPPALEMQAVKAAMELLNEIEQCEALGLGEVEGELVASILEVRLGQVEISLGEVGEGLLVGPLTLARGLDLDQVALVGCNSRWYPGNIEGHWALSDEVLERAGLPERTRSARASRLMQAAREAIALARDMALVSYSRVDESGRELFTSQLVEDLFVKGEIPGSEGSRNGQHKGLSKHAGFGQDGFAASGRARPKKTVLAESLKGSGERLSSPWELDLWLSTPEGSNVGELDPRSWVARAFDEEQTGSLEDIASMQGEFFPVLSFRRSLQVRQSRSSQSLTVFSGLAPSSTSERSYQLGPLSPTRLEELIECPMRYYISRILRLEPPEQELAPGAMDLRLAGSEVHRALEEWVLKECSSPRSQQWLASMLGLEDSSESLGCGSVGDQLDRSRCGPAREQSERPTPLGLIKHVRNSLATSATPNGASQGELARIYLELARFAQLEEKNERRQRALPLAAEVVFGNTAPVDSRSLPTDPDSRKAASVVLEPLRLESHRGELYLEGRIDRVDALLDADGSPLALAVLDYKTGKGVGDSATKRFWQRVLGSPVGLQLPVYALALRPDLLCDGKRDHGGEEPVSASRVLGEMGRKKPLVFMGYWPLRELGSDPYESLELFEPETGSKLLEVLSVLSEILEEGLFVLNPGSNGEHCRKCSWNLICPVERQAQWEAVSQDVRVGRYASMYTDTQAAGS
jgi:hypothetical protein